MPADVRSRADTVPAPPTPASAEAEPSSDGPDAPDWEDPTKPAYRTIAAQGTEERARIKRSSRTTEPMPLPRPPAKRDRDH